MRDMQRKVRKLSPNPGVAEAIRRAGGQAAVAKRFGVRQSFVSHWLNTEILWNWAIELADAYGVPLERIKQRGKR